MVSTALRRATREHNSPHPHPRPRIRVHRRSSRWWLISARVCSSPVPRSGPPYWCSARTDPTWSALEGATSSSAPARRRRRRGQGLPRTGRQRRRRRQSWRGGWLRVPPHRVGRPGWCRESGRGREEEDRCLLVSVVVVLRCGPAECDTVEAYFFGAMIVRWRTLWPSFFPRAWGCVLIERALIAEQHHEGDKDNCFPYQTIYSNGYFFVLTYPL